MDVPSIDYPAIGLPLLPPFWSILGNTLSGNIKVKHTSCTTWTFAQPVARWAMCVARGRKGCSKASAKWGGNWAKPKGCVRTKTIGTKFTGTNVLAYVGRILCFYLSVGCYTLYRLYTHDFWYYIIQSPWQSHVLLVLPSTKRKSMDWFKGKFTGKPHI